ncbi:AraC family transcriptional regulator [Salinisphaera hydrothermalis C41B8]|uniref:AraC family transcriptional regulator n=2 Tax=Salinisphaera TaxID=180541 RepID=A0A084IH91_SALHC|nr:AraC family transcriptional regulator [Salinisphaera hydrothermalis C41B8]
MTMAQTFATTNDWIELNRDHATGIETLRAHFEGHAYDPHWHDVYLFGTTEAGVQQFRCRGRQNVSTPGQAFLLAPGEIHDGNAPEAGGFTYRTMYIEPAWFDAWLERLADDAPASVEPTFNATLAGDPRLVAAIDRAVGALHEREPRMAREAALDDLLLALGRHVNWRLPATAPDDPPMLARSARDYLHAHVGEDVGLDDLAAALGVSRFRVSRAFKTAYGMPPHAYLVQLRVVRARRRLMAGDEPAEIAAALGFADQSHLGRWFRRAYRLSPAAYRRRCTNITDD